MEYKISNADRDVQYWNNYYKTNTPGTIAESNFAEFVLPFLSAHKSIIDLGCGNGRDSIFFLKKKLKVTGVDMSSQAISQLNEKYSSKDAIFICDDFVTSRYITSHEYDYAYSRWTLHAINKQQENIFLKNIYSILKKHGRFFIEARSISDELYGSGEKVGNNEYIFNNHYRRFLVLEELEQTLKEIGFHICLKVEGKNFAPSKSSNPTLIRIIAEK